MSSLVKSAFLELATPLGKMLAVATDLGISRLEFVDKKNIEVGNKGHNHYLLQLKQELDEYFAGQRKFFEVALDLEGTMFQQSVWKVLQTIPFGQTYSYSQQAAALGNPQAVRAVANANRANPVAIVVPCHRVIGKNGSLTGYGGGLDRKKWLLEHEGKSGG